jgi:hypothetical protein
MPTKPEAALETIAPESLPKEMEAPATGKISMPTNPKAALETIAPVSSVETILPYTDHNGRTKCEHCGGCYTSVWRALWTELRENFYTYDPNNDYRLQMTLLGWMVFLGSIWFFTELALGAVFDSYLLDSKFPFIGITIFWRAISRPFETLAWCFGVLFNWTFGDSAAVAEPVATWYKDENRPTTKEWFTAATATTERIVSATTQALDDAGSMWDDDWTPI